MTDQTPVPPPPPPPAAPAAPPAANAYAGPPPPPAPPAPPAPETAGGGGNGKKLIIGGLAAAIVLGGGYGAYAVYDKLDGGGAQPHDVMPATTQAYVRLDLDPSASQKIDLFKLIRKVPELADEAGITSDKADLRELVFRKALASECDNLDYDKDVAPWLGDRIGVGANIADETFLIAVQTTDEDASRAGVKKLFDCADESYGIAFLDGYALIGPEQDDVDKAVTATEKGTLGDSKDFTADFDKLGNQGIASAWVDVEAIAKAPSVKDAVGDQADQLEELAKTGSVATALRADGSAIEVAVLSGASPTSSKATPLGDLPDDTVMALSVAGVGDQVTEGFDAFVQEFDNGLGSSLGGFGPSADNLPSDVPSTDADTISTVPTVPEPTISPDGLGTDDPFGDDMGTDDPFADDFGNDDPFGNDFGGGFTAQDFIDQIEQSTGFKLPEDLVTLFGDSLTLAVGSDNLENLPNISGPEEFSNLDIALSLKSEKAPALDLVQRIATLASDAGIPLVASPSDDGAVLATNQDAADAVADADGSLGDSKTFQSVIPEGGSAFGGFYLDIGTILDKVLQANPPEDVRKDIESAKALSAVGVSSVDSDGSNLTRLRVAFK